MFLRHKLRRKDGQEHRYWSIVEKRRVSGGRTVQRHVLYLGEINDSQRAAWCQTIEAFDENRQSGKQIALFPEDRAAPPLDCDVVHVRLSGLRLRRPRQWGGCWLACHLWDQLQLDEFWSPRLPVSRQGTRWLNVLKTLVAYRLIDPGSEWRLHRQWFERSDGRSGVKPGPVVTLAGGMVFIEAIRWNAGPEQRIALQVEHLRTIRLAHTHVADQHGEPLLHIRPIM